MSNTRAIIRVFLTCATLAALIAGAAYAAFGASRLTLAALGDGERFALSLRTDENSAQSSPNPSAVLSISRHGNNLTVQIDRQDAVGETYNGWWQKDGTLGLQLADKAEPLPLEVREFNLVAAMLVGAPPEPKLNDTWKANLDVPFAERQTVRIATHVTVIGFTRQGLELQAIGRAKATLNRPAGRGARGGRGLGMQGGGGGFPGSNFPRGRGGFERGRAPSVDVAVNLDSDFAAGTFVSAKGTIQQTADGQSQPDSSVTWSFMPLR